MKRETEQMIERIVYAAVMAALAWFGAQQSRRAEVKSFQVEQLREANLADLENYRQFVIETMEKCRCEE